jgi:hypothetical protein
MHRDATRRRRRRRKKLSERGPGRKDGRKQETKVRNDNARAAGHSRRRSPVHTSHAQLPRGAQIENGGGGTDRMDRNGGCWPGRGPGEGEGEGEDGGTVMGIASYELTVTASLICDASAALRRTRQLSLSLSLSLSFSLSLSPLNLFCPFTFFSRRLTPPPSSYRFLHLQRFFYPFFLLAPPAICLRLIDCARSGSISAKRRLHHCPPPPSFLLRQGRFSFAPIPSALLLSPFSALLVCLSRDIDDADNGINARLTCR